MKKIYMLQLFLTLTFGAFAQTGSLEGTLGVSDGNPLPYAHVMLVKTNYGTTSDINGHFVLKNIPSGSYTLKISELGYQTFKKNISIQANTTTSLPKIVLEELIESLDEVVVNGNGNNKYVNREPSTSLRLKTELAKLPQNIQVINSDLLKDQQATNIMEGVTRNVSGVTMIEHWGHFARVNMRGFRLPAFRNGINVQDTWGPLSEDMNTVDRIEFVKGPAGFMMSAGEPGGFYNVVTKKPTANKIAELSFTAGSFDNYRGTIDLGGKLTDDEKLLFRLNGMYQTSDSHRGNEDASRYGIAPSLSYRFSDKTIITTELNLQQAESFIGSSYVFAPTPDGYASLDRDFKYTDNNYPVTDIQEVTFFTNLSHSLSDHWTIESQFAYLRYDQEGNSFWIRDIAENGDVHRYISLWDALSTGKYFQAYLYGDFKTGAINHSVLGGFDYTQKHYLADFYQAFDIDTATPFNIYNPVYDNTPSPSFDRSLALQNRNGGQPYMYGAITKAYYAQDEIGFLDNRIRLTLAGRYTQLATEGKDEQDEKFTPRAGISIDILPSLAVYGLYDQSFIGQSGVSFAGETFDPVDAIDIEGGLKKSFFDGRLKTSLGAYQITKQNVLVGDPENPNFSIQLGKIQSKGIEFDLQGQVSPELNVVLNYANTNVEITEDTNTDNIGKRMAGHAKHVTNGWLNYQFNPSSSLKGFGISLGYQYQVDRSSWSWGADNQTDLPDYFRLDGALSWKNNKLKVQLNINNLLDEYLYSGSNYGSYLYWQSEPGINGRLTVTYKLF
ncbi:iron complex outermembrane recepter protein [Zobellia uliginosa]|uniref:Iron complex outermembrane recepter protein n=1 Tax=Zobellia uliginosa TaxID=143224 RepID=A0ABY1KWK1_9FLAO|nr:TonB-dependent receptor [Zobellia uliginosa]SIS86802.1 iron complex outermembrane recepter protein [Zobellia uliginosa]